MLIIVDEYCQRSRVFFNIKLTPSSIWQIILDVPTVGGRLMLVDMAGSENIEQAGQTGMEAKMQVRSFTSDAILLIEYSSMVCVVQTIFSYKL